MTSNRQPRRRGRPPTSAARDTRGDLLDAALELFAAAGYAGTSVRQIAAAVGVSESALYSHFPGKQAIYDELFDRIGPVSWLALDVTDEDFATADPETLLPELVRRLTNLWSEREARLFTSVLAREGLGTGSLGGLPTAVAQARAAWRPVFERWRKQKRLRADISVDQLVWEFFTPLVTIRFLHMNAQSDDAELTTGKDLARRHLDFFFACAGAGGATRHRPMRL